MTEPEAPLQLWTLDEPALEPGAVLLETIASEVCGTDVHLHHGRLAGVPYPIIPGHVSVGRVLESAGVGRDAVGTPIAPGDTVTFYDVHEICHACYWSERIYLKPGVKIFKLPEPLSADAVIGGGCGLFTGFGAVERSELEMGDTVLVQGAGPVGLSAAAFAALRGAEQVIVIGAPDARLELGTRLGADVTLSLEDLSREERSSSVRELTSGRGADVVIEASGNPDAVPEGFDLLRDGGTYVIAGHYTDVGPVEINPHLDINRKHADVRGHWGTDFRHVVRALRMLARHRDRLPFADVIGKRYGLDQANEALEDVAALRVTKAIIQPG